MEPLNEAAPGSDSGRADSGQAVPTGDRRAFAIKAIALLSGAAAYLVPALAGLISFLNPLGRKSEAGEFHRLASLDDLLVGGPPQKFSVIADRTDAWNRFPNEPIGAVFLHRVKKDEVLAINVVCPHAGCSIQYESESNKFFCPCHNASFDLLTGKPLDSPSPSPRPLDSLDVDPAALKQGEVRVKFQNFRTGTSDKIEEA